MRVRTLKRRGRRAGRTDEVLLDRAAARALRGYLRHTWRALIGRLPAPADPLFPRGPVPAWSCPTPARRMSRQNAAALFRLYRRRAGLRATLVIHSLRHYRGTVLWETTKDLEFSRQQMRHQSSSTTREYLHVTKKRAMRYMADLERGTT